MKTLIIITPGFPKDEDDSVCLPTQQLFVKTLHQLFPKINIVVISLHYPYHTSTYDWNGIKVYSLNGKSRKGFFRICLWYQSYRLLSQICKDIDCLGILSFWSNESALIGNYFAKRKNIRHIIWISGQDARKENRFVKWIRPMPQNLVAMSDFLKTEFEKNHGIRVDHVIHNAVVETFSHASRDIDLIAAGSFIPLKQFEIFIEVIYELKKHHRKISALIVGKGPVEKSLKHLAEKLQLEDSIRFVGEVDHAELMALMNRAKVLVHPSNYEGYSTVCLEALANGCHVVSFTYAENEPVKNWHIVKNKTEMVRVVNNLLTTELRFEPTIVRDMRSTAKKMMALFEKEVRAL